MPSPTFEPEYEFDLSGGALCLDFANTVSRRKVPERSTEHVVNFEDLIAFAEQTNIVTAEQAGELRLYTRRRSGEAQSALRRATSFRENLFRVFSALAQGTAVAPNDLKPINDAALEALTHRRLAAADEGFRWEWEWNGGTMLDRILWAIAQSAAELLTSSELEAVRTCEAPDCAWLFLDHSRNRSRRWCDMKVCGNRQKARRHYQRTHQ